MARLSSFPVSLWSLILSAIIVLFTVCSLYFFCPVVFQYLASNTAASLYEKDHQYRELGFEISSFSGCRVIVHHQLGTRPYVGCIFTKAPLDHPLIANLVHSLEKTESF